MTSMPLKKRLERGSVLVLSAFLLLVVTLITVSYWKLLEMRILITGHKEQELRAYFAARAGIEDAIYELVQGYDWKFDEPGLSVEWQYLDQDTFYKTNVGNSMLDYFEYPVSFSVTVEGDIESGLVTINSLGQVSKSLGHQLYSKQLEAVVQKSFNGDIVITSIGEI